MSRRESNSPHIDTRKHIHHLFIESAISHISIKRISTQCNCISINRKSQPCATWTHRQTVLSTWSIEKQKKYIRSVEQFFFFGKEKREQKNEWKKEEETFVGQTYKRQPSSQKTTNSGNNFFEWYVSWFHFQFSVSSVCRHEPALSHTFTHGYFVERIETAKPHISIYSDHFKSKRRRTEK